MMNLSSARRLVACTTLALLVPCVTAWGDDPLPSWNEGPTKQAFLDRTWVLPDIEKVK